MHNQARLWRFWVGLLLLSCVLLPTGCGSSQGTVSGKVSYKGQPLKGGTVGLFPATGGGQTAQIQEDGSYTFTKVSTGPAKLSVETKSIKPMTQQAMQGPYAKMPKDAIPPGGKSPFSQGDATKYVPIPEQYGNPETSELTYTVVGGKQEHPIDLK